MHEMKFLPDLVLLITVAILIIIVFQKFKIPSVIGLILTGVLVGPSGFKIVDDMDVINSLSELGVSSTRICLKILKERKELNQEHGKISLGILIFQDIAIVPLMIGVSFLNPAESSSFGKIAKDIGLMILLGGGIFGGFRFFLPKLLRMISHLQAQEVWVLGGLALCFGAAYLSHLAGLSLALGAFVIK